MVWVSHGVSSPTSTSGNLTVAGASCSRPSSVRLAPSLPSSDWELEAPETDWSRDAPCLAPVASPNIWHMWMSAKSRAFALVLLGLIGPAPGASASTTIPISHDWTFRVGGKEFGLVGYPKGFFDHRTVIWYGYGYSTSRFPVPVVAALTGIFPLLVCSGCFLSVRRRNDDASEQ